MLLKSTFLVQFYSKQIIELLNLFCTLRQLLLIKGYLALQVIDTMLLELICGPLFFFQLLIFPLQLKNLFLLIVIY